MFVSAAYLVAEILVKWLFYKLRKMQTVLKT